MTSLYAWRKEEVELVGAIADCAEALQGAVGLFYSLPWCRFGQLMKQQVDNTTTVRDFEGDMKLNLVFEARIFNANAELRWLKSGSTGAAVILSESETLPGLDWSLALDAMKNLEPLDTISYLLWGEGTNIPSNNEWSCLTAARIGKLYVPISGVKPNHRVQLVAKEYTGKVDCYGNMAVVEERLIELKSYRGE